MENQSNVEWPGPPIISHSSAGTDKIHTEIIGHSILLKLSHGIYDTGLYSED